MRMTDKRIVYDADLEDLFAAARAAPIKPDQDLLARIMADADAELPTSPWAVTVPEPARRAGIAGRFRDWVGAIGGWPAAAGLASAAVAGLAIGFGSPQTVDTLSGGYFLAGNGDVYDVESLMPSYGDLLSEG